MRLFSAALDLLSEIFTFTRVKKLLLVFFLSISFIVLSSRTVCEEPDSTAVRYTEEFVFSQVPDSTELPSLLVLETALAGYEILNHEQAITHTGIITIIDFSLPSDKERLWVLDLIHGKVLFHCLVSHGRNSGELMAEYFSNKPGSYASSPGFYATGETYIGRNGLSLFLDGLEAGINDNARDRAIVMHGAGYVSPEYIREYGRLGRSYGCPAVPEEMSREIIQSIKGGSCLFIYAPVVSYISNSQIITRIISPTKGKA
ncbi:MAG: murein L,D-transpeptidase catalytic domain family protein [Bacteroidales bacterium]|nr:murein L,D-transpeptidase catalytic domain family protein [Bacteroidales bacterium]